MSPLTSLTSALDAIQSLLAMILLSLIALNILVLTGLVLGVVLFLCRNKGHQCVMDWSGPLNTTRKTWQK